MKYIIYDVKNEEIANKIGNLKNKNISTINASKPTARCIGCYNCWLKKPGRCKFKDKIEWIGKELINSEQTIIICEQIYCGFSIYIKKIIDRSIPGIMPFFKNKNNELHHLERYKVNSSWIIIFYNAKNMTEKEKDFSKELMNRVKINFHLKQITIKFLDNEKNIMEEI